MKVMQVRWRQGYKGHWSDWAEMPPDTDETGWAWLILSSGPAPWIAENDNANMVTIFRDSGVQSQYRVGERTE